MLGSPVAHTEFDAPHTPARLQVAFTPMSYTLQNKYALDSDSTRLSRRRLVFFFLRCRATCRGVTHASTSLITFLDDSGAIVTQLINWAAGTLIPTILMLTCCSPAYLTDVPE